jgi:hypothetical protein
MNKPVIAHIRNCMHTEAHGMHVGGTDRDVVANVLRGILIRTGVRRTIEFSVQIHHRVHHLRVSGDARLCCQIRIHVMREALEMQTIERMAATNYGHSRQVNNGAARAKQALTV